ncbi:sensor histidine kinase [Glycomyces artemisiae]|uniref:Oxygen sensor histidine kinase NreB n=1 Tax=Glycomyces artemisiae TaxID=1076443 RepID=A0A2T0UD92_9ACTN|nr:sensor histidine kinase [Glycomyces artemisiae]PRY55906.1 signal transduction histidine kinase [Glycomyces artemisiae]
MTDAGRLDRWERRLEAQVRLAPYVLLVIAAVLYWSAEDAAPGDRAAVLGLAAAAAAWVRFAAGRLPGRVYIAVLVGFIAALGACAIWFTAFFGFTGYLHSWRFLKGHQRFAGVALTAAVSVPAYLGLPGTAAELLVCLLFTAAITALVGLFSFVGDVTAERSAERKRTVDRLEAALAENAGLHAQLLVQAREAGIMDERQRIAAEIHDTLAQGFTGIIAQLEAVKRPADWEERSGKAMRLAREGLAEARRTVHAVVPAQLEAAALPDALEAVVQAWSELHGVPAECAATGTVRPLHPEVEAALLRVAQEALANAAKYSDASRAAVTLSYIDEVVALDVLDDGAGFDPARVAEAGGFGLTSMRRRVERLGGEFVIESAPGEGTAVSATLPATAREGTTA